MPATEAKAFISGGSKAKEGIVPVVNGKDCFGVVCGHEESLVN